MLIEYLNTSPYYTTDLTDGYLATWNYRDIPAESDDILFQVDEKYKNRPDLLAYDLYDDVKLWWVFAVRNPSVIQDPVFDMVPGVEIYLPKISTIKKSLGI
jgi:hypothetical protein